MMLNPEQRGKPKIHAHSYFCGGKVGVGTRLIIAFARINSAHSQPVNEGEILNASFHEPSKPAA
jgi:hypothetical protein